MADFAIAYARTAKNEGGYAHHLKDRGGETFHGIARKYWPLWKGWELIDAHRSKFPREIHIPASWRTVDHILSAEKRLPELVRRFYRVNFWDDIEGDRIDSQEVANILYDWAVNSGEGSPAKAVQRIVGAKVDGDIGPATVAKINAYQAQELLPTLLRAERVKMVREIVRRDPSQAVFLDGWIERAQNA